VSSQHLQQPSNSTSKRESNPSNHSSTLAEEEQTVGEQSFQPDDFLGTSIAKLAEEDSTFDESDFAGILDLHQSEFDQAAISVITNMTTQTKESKSSTMPSSQQSTIPYEYPTTTPEPDSTSGMRFDELYRLKGVLGTGAFSTVREGYHRNNNSISFAVKCINRKKLSEEDEAALLDEVSILQELKHQHIIRLFDFFDEPNTYYLVMERMRGGELFDRIVAKAYYNEKEARDTCKIVLEAVGYCHENHVAHRDLKPENLLLLSDVDDSQVKIADFGFAKKVYEPNSLTTQCGTPGYVAPEILEGTAYDERADMWSVGVILYILLGGYPPFIESTQRDLFRKIRKGDYEFHEEYWGTVSAEAKELISSLLTVDSTDRLTADEALENEWILGDDAKLASKDLGGNLEKLRNFNAKRKFRAAVHTVMAANKLNLMSKDFFANLKE
jgi:calcium/calmodulin-dependent protein kinase I